MTALELSPLDELCRRPRRWPLLWQIADYWLERGTFEMRLAEPWCFACHLTAPPWLTAELDGLPLKKRWLAASRFLIRAHLVDHCAGGLDTVTNIVPLCNPCHNRMPEFYCGTGRWAIAWVQGGGYWRNVPRFLQRYTAAWTSGLFDWELYVGCCAGACSLDLAAAERCALAIDFTGHVPAVEFDHADRLRWLP